MGLVSPTVQELRTCLLAALEWMESAWNAAETEYGSGGKTLDQACADGDEPEIAAVRAMVAKLSAPPMVAYHYPVDYSQAAPDASQTRNAPKASHD